MNIINHREPSVEQTLLECDLPNASIQKTVISMYVASVGSNVDNTTATDLAIKCNALWSGNMMDSFMAAFDSEFAAREFATKMHALSVSSS